MKLGASRLELDGCDAFSCLVCAGRGDARDTLVSNEETGMEIV